jgi:phage tail tape-measure protein
MRDYTAEIAAKKAELNAKLAAKSNKELLKDCAQAGVPEGKEQIVAIGAEIIVGMLSVSTTASVVGNFCRVFGGAMGAAAIYSGVRSGVMAKDEWSELARRGLAKVFPQKEKSATSAKTVVSDEVCVTPLKSTPELVAQAMALQGRKL